MKTRTRIYTCNAFKGFYPVGSAAVIEAADAAQAARLLNARLHDIGLAGDVLESDMIPFPKHDRESVRILCDGNY